MLMSEFITAQKQIQFPAPELIAKAAEEKVRAEMKTEEQAKELQVLQEENNRLRNEIKVLQEYKEKHTGNFAGYVTNKNNRENKSKYRTINLYQKYKDMGALVMFGLVSVIAIVGVIYFNYQEKKGK